MERRGDRRDTREEARDVKRECKAGDEATRPSAGRPSATPSRTPGRTELDSVGTIARSLDQARSAAGSCRLLAAAVLLCAPLLASAAPELGPASEDGARRPGKFVWYELVTDDAPAARPFYEAVFGWRLHAVPGAPAGYTIIENGGNRVAGMFFHARLPGSSRGARWLTLISVPDVAAAARLATQQGGEIVAPPAKVSGRGMHALLRDSEGALIGVLAAQAGDPADTPVADGDFFWTDLFAREPQRAALFYQSLAGYEVSSRPSGAGFERLILQSQGYARAGIVPLPAALKEAGWLPYVLVNDVAGTIEKAIAAQGRVLVPPSSRLLDGNLAVIADPLGGVLGIVNWLGDGEEARQ
jgi:hypothetical protein